MREKEKNIFLRLSPLDVYVIDKVKALRQKGIKGKYISQSELGRLLGFNNSFISHIEMYKKKYSIESINLLAKIFKCSPKDFFPKKHIKDDYIIERIDKRNIFRGYIYNDIVEMKRNPDYVAYLKKTNNYNKTIGKLKIQDKHYIKSLKEKFKEIENDYRRLKINSGYILNEEKEKKMFFFNYELHSRRKYVEYLISSYPDFQQWFFTSNITFPTGYS